MEPAACRALTPAEPSTAQGDPRSPSRGILAHTRQHGKMHPTVPCGDLQLNGPLIPDERQSISD